MKKNDLVRKYQKSFTAVLVSAMVFSSFSGTVFAAETEMLESAIETQQQSSGVESLAPSTEMLAEPVTEVSTEAPTEPVTEVSTEAPTEPVTEISTEAPAENAIEVSTNPPTEELSEPVTEIPTETQIEEPAGDIDETSTEPVTENPTEAPAEMIFDLAVKFSLGMNQLRIKEEQQSFVRSLFSEDEIRQGGHGNVVVYADLLDDLLKDEQDKTEEQKLSEEERNLLKAEKAVLEQWSESNGYTVAQYFSLRLFRQRNNEIPLRITESNERLSMILETAGVQADDMILVYVKDGQAMICDDADNCEDIIAFDSRTFGTYALVYHSVIPEPDTESETEKDTENEMEDRAEDTESPDSIVMDVIGSNAVYHPGSRGQWNPDTHCYENGTSGKWIYEEGEGKVIFANTGNEDVTLILSYHPSALYEKITGVFRDQNGKSVQKLSIPAGNTVTVYLSLSGEADPGINGEVIGTVSYELAGQGGD
ncbi:MAG: hypothetical protein ACI4F0_10290 [Agathobacter sp.]